MLCTDTSSKSFVSFSIGVVLKTASNVNQLLFQFINSVDTFTVYIHYTVRYA